MATWSFYYNSNTLRVCNTNAAAFTVDFVTSVMSIRIHSNQSRLNGAKENPHPQVLRLSNQNVIDSFHALSPGVEHIFMSVPETGHEL